jgi:hypothetical protein
MGLPNSLSYGAGTFKESRRFLRRTNTVPTHIKRRQFQEMQMGRGILLWLLGVPIPVIILLALLFR